ncbi:MAG: alpha/beta hydrolase [Myxococcota bacterium]
MVPIVFAHGLEGHPEGTKVQWLKKQGFDVLAPDGQGLVLQDRLVDLERETRRGGVLLVGSSYGGLAAAWLAHQYPDRFVGLLLLAPALHHTEPPVVDAALLTAPVTIPTRVIHGVSDDIVPIDVSRRYCQQSGSHTHLVEVDDGHRLAGSLSVISQAAAQLMGMHETP